MQRTIFARAVLIVTLLLAPLAAAQAQDLQRIAAIVNDDIISMYDLVGRIDLVMVSGRLPDTPEVRKRIEPQVLRSMIDERLQMQEAKRRNITVTKADLDKAIGAIEADNKLPAGGLKEYMKQGGLREDTLLDQIRASVAWQKVIARQFRPTVNITSEQVDEAMAEMKASQGQEEAHVYEILLTVDSPSEENAVHDNARRLVEQLRGGAVFEALARQFSRGPAAALGGDLGWLRPGEMDPAVASAVSGLSTGQITEPIRTIAGFHILAVRDRRRSGAASAGDIKVSLDQIFLPVSGGAAERATQVELARTLRETVNGCEDMKKAAEEARSPRPPHLGDFTLKDLSPQLREVVEPLREGQVSQPLATGDGVLLVMVCKRDEPNSKLPDRDDVERMLMVQRLNMLAQRYLRDLRLASIVDVRV